MVMPAMPEQRLPQRPTTGTYTLRFVKDGPRVPALLECVSVPADTWCATVGGLRVHRTRSKKGNPLHPIDEPLAVYTGEQIEEFVFAHMMAEYKKLTPEASLFARIVSGGHVITQMEYDRLLRVAAHYRKVFPQHPMLNWYQPIDLSKIPSLGRLRPPPGAQDV